MATKKKTFLEEDNPALQFISKAKPKIEKPKQTEPKPRPADLPPEGYKLNPLYVETKSRRVQLVLQPSLYERAKAAAEEKGVSFNDYVHTLLEEATKEREE